MTSDLLPRPAAPVTWEQVEQANEGPHGPWNGGGGDVEYDVEDRLGVAPEDAVWTRESVPLALVRPVREDLLDPSCDGCQSDDCGYCYCLAILPGTCPPVTVIPNPDGTFWAPDGRHRIAGHVLHAAATLNVFVARTPTAD